jgi:hypothetical protein
LISPSPLEASSAVTGKVMPKQAAAVRKSYCRESVQIQVVDQLRQIFRESIKIIAPARAIGTGEAALIVATTDSAMMFRPAAARPSSPKSWRRQDAYATLLRLTNLIHRNSVAPAMLYQRQLVRSHRLRDLERTLRKRHILERSRSSLTRQHGRKIHTLRGKRTLFSGWFEKGIYSSRPKLVQGRVFTGDIARKLFHIVNHHELG